MKSHTFKSPKLLALVAILVAGILVWQFIWREQPPAFDIQTAAISRGQIERSISATGSVQALVTVDVSSQLSGQISQVNVDFNTEVKKGGTLAVIDPRTFSSRVTSADANLAIAKANVEVQQASVVKAVALRDQAKRALERQKALIESRATSAATLDQAQTQFDTAVADEQVASAQLSTARAAVSQKQAELAQAKLDLDRTEIRTPIDGVVIARNVDPGSTVAASLQAPILFQIAQDLKQIEILVLVDEADIGAIETGQDVTFTVDAFPNRVFDGKVAQVRIAGKTTSNVVTYTVVVGAHNPQQKLLPGMTATVRIITGTRSGVLRVPNDAVRFTPPKDMPATSHVERPNRDQAIVDSLAERLKLSEEQKEKFRKALAADRAARGETDAPPSTLLGKGGSGGKAAVSSSRRQSGTVAGASQNSQRRRGRVSRALEGILTDEQKVAFKQSRDDWRDTTRPAIVWQETPKGLAPHRLILGLADETFSEILRGDLKKDDKVVVRARSNGGTGGQRAERTSR
jgi:HlyD family secretion protein